MFEHPLERTRFVVDGEAIDDRRAGFVHADDLHLRALSAEFQHHLVQRAHGGEITVQSEPGSGATFVVRIPLRRSGAIA